MDVFAKNKAKELVEYFRDLVDPRVDGGHGYVFSREEQTRKCKQCAVKSVEQIINEIQSYSDLKSFISINDEYVTVVDRLVYWSEVKQKISKL